MRRPGATLVGRDMAGSPLLTVENLTKHFSLKGGLLNRRKGVVKAVDDVSFTVRNGETLGIVGKSGCGKSTTARLLMHLISHDSGRISFDGRLVGAAQGVSHRDLHRQMQMVFQRLLRFLEPTLAGGDVDSIWPVHSRPGEGRRAAARHAVAASRGA